uniref:P-type domain-containing protein n=2 Tax=Ciona savignyi TaxID=51511 RepID=H2YX67_CIOSA
MLLRQHYQSSSIQIARAMVLLQTESFVTEEERCSRVAHANRIGCFPVNSMNGLDINDVVTRQTCESGSGCCYEQVTLSFLERGLGVRKPPTCYKKMSVVIAPTQAAPTTTAAPAAPAPVCKDRDTLAPTSREDCGQFDYHECVRVKGCCYMPEILIPGAPWCFKKT